MGSYNTIQYNACITYVYPVTAVPQKAVNWIGFNHYLCHEYPNPKPTRQIVESWKSSRQDNKVVPSGIQGWSAMLHRSVAIYNPKDTKISNDGRLFLSFSKPINTPSDLTPKSPITRSQQTAWPELSHCTRCTSERNNLGYTLGYARSPEYRLRRTALWRWRGSELQ